MLLIKIFCYDNGIHLGIQNFDSFQFQQRSVWTSMKTFKNRGRSEFGGSQVKKKQTQKIF